jgi:uncharacterized protein
MKRRRLLTSIHDVTPFHTERLERLVPLVEEKVGAGRYALLVVPDFHLSGKLSDHPSFMRKLRGWSAAGCEIFLHGFTHLDASTHVTQAARMKAKRMTAGEGEFLGLDHSSATTKLIEGRKMIEDATGQAVAGFIAPAWLYSDDSLAALADQGFTLAEDHFRVWNPTTAKILARGPVITYASRSSMRLASSILWSRIASVILARAQTVRFGVHPHDVDSTRLLKEISRALTALTRSHKPGRYSELLL